MLVAQERLINKKYWFQGVELLRMQVDELHVKTEISHQGFHEYNMRSVLRAYLKATFFYVK